MTTEDIGQAWESEIDLREVLEIIWRGKWIIIGLVVLAAVAAGFISTQLLEPTYEATATLLIMPPTYQTSIEPKPLALETYRDLALTPDIASQIIRRLNLTNGDGKLLPAEAILRNVTVNIVASNNEQSRSEAQRTGVLHLKATWNDPDIVRDIANTWAEIFMETTASIRKNESENVSGVILNQFRSTEDALIHAEDRLLEFRSKNQLPVVSQNVSLYREELYQRTAHYESLLRELETKESRLQAINTQLQTIETNGTWIGLRNLDVTVRTTGDPLQARILEARDKYNQAEAALRVFDNNSRLTLLEQQLDLYRKKAADYRAKLMDLRSLESTLPRKLETLRESLEQQERTLVMHRSITDDALWMALSERDAGLGNVDSIRLSDETPNPNYQYLERQLTDTELELSSIPASIATYQELLDDSSKQMVELEAAIRTLQQERDSLVQEFEVAKNVYDTLRNQYLALKQEALNLSLAIDQLKLEISTAFGNIREYESKANQAQQQLLALQLEEERLVREKDAVQKTYSTLASHAEVARITELQATGDVRFISQAIAPYRPSGPRHLLNITIAVVLAGMIGLVIVFMMNMFQTPAKRQSVAGLN